MLLDHYVSAMDSWKGRIDSETDYDAFRWHQWVQPIDLNDGSAPFTGKLGFAFIGFCSDKGVARNKGRTGTALAPDFVRGQMSGLPCTFSQEVKLYDAGDIICDEISLEGASASWAAPWRKFCAGTCSPSCSAAATRRRSATSRASITS